MRLYTVFSPLFSSREKHCDITIDFEDPSTGYCVDCLFYPCYISSVLKRFAVDKNYLLYYTVQ